MKKISMVLLILSFISCSKQKENLVNPEVSAANNIIGTWKLVYGEVKENDSVSVRDISKSDFIKIINETHFSYFNQGYQEPRNFY